MGLHEPLLDHMVQEALRVGGFGGPRLRLPYCPRCQSDDPAFYNIIIDNRVVMRRGRAECLDCGYVEGEPSRERHNG